MSRPVSLPKALKPYLHTVTGKRVFGLKRFVNGAWTSEHNGVDFATPTGLPLESGIRGRVSLVGGSLTHSWGYYLHIICDCPKRHVQEFHVLQDRPNFNVGDPVHIGQVVARTGSSGSFNRVRYAPHHHHGTSENGKYFDPLDIGWPEGADDGSTPFDNTEDDMSAADIAALNARFDNIEKILATEEGGGIRATSKAAFERASDALGVARNVESILAKDNDGGLRKAVADVHATAWETKATAKNIEAIIAVDNGGGLRAVIDRLSAGGTDVSALAEAIVEKLPNTQAATKQDVVDALGSLTFKAAL